MGATNQFTQTVKLHLNKGPDDLLFYYCPLNMKTEGQKNIIMGFFARLISPLNLKEFINW